MMPGTLLAALTVSGAPGVGCPDRDAIVERVHAAGVVIRDDEDIDVRFSWANGKRVAEIARPGAATRAIEHEGPDCSSLADATVALLSVLLDARSPRSPRSPGSPDAAAPPSPLPEAHSVVRGEAAMLFSSGIVAPLGAGATIGVAWRPVRWGSIGVSVETWPGRDHALREGTMTVSASTVALVGCGGPAWRTLLLEGCVLGHGGLYGLSAVGFPVTHPETRFLFGGEAAVRASLALAWGLAIFARAGVWLPFTRLDVTVRGADTGFATTTFGPKGALGLELNL